MMKRRNLSETKKKTRTSKQARTASAWCVRIGSQIFTLDFKERFGRSIELKEARQNDRVCFEVSR